MRGKIGNYVSGNVKSQVFEKKLSGQEHQALNGVMISPNMQFASNLQGSGKQSPVRK
jgi:hypothetical protein